MTFLTEDGKCVLFSVHVSKKQLKCKPVNFIRTALPLQMMIVSVLWSISSVSIIIQHIVPIKPSINSLTVIIKRGTNGKKYL